MSEIKLSEFIAYETPQQGKVDLTETAARLDEAALEKLKAAEKIDGSNEEFQGILVALAIKGGVASDIVDELDPNLRSKHRLETISYSGETPEPDKFIDLVNLTGDAVDNVIARLVEARKETLRTDEKGLGDFREEGPFRGKEGGPYAGESNTTSPLQKILKDYQDSNKGLDLETTTGWLVGFENDILIQARKALQSMQREKAAQERTILGAKAASTRDRILGPLAEVLREKADRSQSRGDSIGTDHAAQK